MTYLLDDTFELIQQKLKNKKGGRKQKTLGRNSLCLSPLVTKGDKLCTNCGLEGNAEEIKDIIVRESLVVLNEVAF